MQAFFLPARLGSASAGKRNDDAISRRRSADDLVARMREWNGDRELVVRSGA